MNYKKAIQIVNEAHSKDEKYTSKIKVWIEYFLTLMAKSDKSGLRIVPNNLNLHASKFCEEEGCAVRDTIDNVESQYIIDILVSHGFVNKHLIYDCPDSFEEMVVEDEDDISYYTDALKQCVRITERFAKGELTEDQMNELLSHDSCFVYSEFDGIKKYLASEVIKTAYEYSDKIDLDKKIANFSKEDLLQSIYLNLSKDKADMIIQGASSIAFNNTQK